VTPLVAAAGDTINPSDATVYNRDGGSTEMSRNWVAVDVDCDVESRVVVRGTSMSPRSTCPTTDVRVRYADVSRPDQCRGWSQSQTKLADSFIWNSEDEDYDRCSFIQVRTSLYQTWNSLPLTLRDPDTIGVAREVQWVHLHPQEVKKFSSGLI